MFLLHKVLISFDRKKNKVGQSSFSPFTKKSGFKFQFVGGWWIDLQSQRLSGEHLEGIFVARFLTQKAAFKFLQSN